MYKKGTVLMWKAEDKGYVVFGRVSEDNSDWCDVIIGDGDGSTKPGEPFFANEASGIADDSVIKVVKDPNLVAIINGYADYLNNR